MDISQVASGKVERQPNGLRFLVLVGGLGLALAVAVVLMRWLMSPSLTELLQMVTELSKYSVPSLLVGALLFYGVTRQSRSLNLTLAAASAMAALLCLFNVWVVARLMFFDVHDFTLTSVLLVFAAIVATAFGIFATMRVARDLQVLMRAAGQVAAGDLRVRAAVAGRDEVARMAAAFNDMAAQLQAAEQQRKELEKLRTDLIAWTSHDLRTPLTSIRAMVEALHDGLVEDEETVQRYYRTIRSDIVALNSLLDDLFELAQLDAGGLKLEMMDHSLSDLISDALESFDAVARQQQVELKGEVGSDLDPVVLNAPKIGRVLANLISNALRYTPPGGHILVTGVRQPQGVVVQVQDSGPGFNPADLKRVFERFYRGEESRTRAMGGAGLGLAIARAIVDAHHGRIWAENGKHGGAIVAFELPNSPPRPQRD